MLWTQRRSGSCYPHSVGGSNLQIFPMISYPIKPDHPKNSVFTVVPGKAFESVRIPGSHRNKLWRWSIFRGGFGDGMIECKNV